MNLTIIAIIFFVLGLTFFITALRRLVKRHVLAAAGHSMFSVVMLSIGALFAAIGLNFYTYDRLVYKQTIADVHAYKIDNQRYRLLLVLPDGKKNEFDVNGDQWRLDVRVIKWKPQGNILGFNSIYRLERLSGRYEKLTQEVSNSGRTAYQLNKDPGLKVWDFTKKYKNQLPYFDTMFGGSVYMPLANKAHYRVHINQGGLSAEPANDEAIKARDNWP